MFRLQASLTLDESHLNASNVGDISTDDNAVDMPIKHEDDPNSIGLTNCNERIPILDDDDDVIVLPQEDPIVTEIPDDDDHAPKDATASKAHSNSHDAASDMPAGGVTISKDTGFSSQLDNEHKTGLFALKKIISILFLDSLDDHTISNISCNIIQFAPRILAPRTDDDVGKNNESDVQILEPQISILDLDEYEETNVSSNTLNSAELLAITKIKQEPKYEGYEDDEDDGFEEVGTFEADPAEILEETSGTVRFYLNILPFEGKKSQLN